MCESIEAYANEIAEARAIDTAVRTCIKFNASKEETLKVVKDEFIDTPDSYILGRIELLWNQKKEN